MIGPPSRQGDALRRIRGNTAGVAWGAGVTPSEQLGLAEWRAVRLQPRRRLAAGLAYPILAGLNRGYAVETWGNPPRPAHVAMFPTDYARPIPGSIDKIVSSAVIWNTRPCGRSGLWIVSRRPG